MTGTRVGWIGTGVMGAPMCGHLLASGYPVTVFNRTPERARGLLERGAAWAESPQAVAQHADVVFTMVGFPDDLREIVLGPAGTLAGAGHGTILVDMTTSEPSLAREIYEAARARGVASLDAPVSGGDVGARAAGLSIMVGGDQDAFERVAPLLRCLGATIVHQGPAGAGQHTKMVNQILVASGMVAVSEALLYAHQAGLDLPTVLQSVSGGAAGSWSLTHYRRASSPGTSRRASAWTTSSRTWASRWRRRGGCASRCRASPWWSSSISRSSRRATAARARMPSCSRSRGFRPWSGRLHLQHLRRRVERADRRRHARVARGLHQHLDQLLARDAEVEGAREVQLQLLGPSERRELCHGAQAPAAQIEVRARPEHAEHELRHQAEELRCELLRRQLPAAGARAPELRRDLEAAREVVRLSRHRVSPL